MKWFMGVMGGMLCMVLWCGAQPGDEQRLVVATSSTPLLLGDEDGARRQAFFASMRDHSIDLLIAGLYGAGSGFPGMSEKLSLAFNTAASCVWFTDTVVRMGLKWKAYAVTQRAQAHDLTSIVVDK